MQDAPPAGNHDRVPPLPLSVNDVTRLYERARINSPMTPTQKACLSPLHRDFTLPKSAMTSPSLATAASPTGVPLYNFSARGPVDTLPSPSQYYRELDQNVDQDECSLSLRRCQSAGAKMFATSSKSPSVRKSRRLSRAIPYSKLNKSPRANENAVSFGGSSRPTSPPYLLEPSRSSTPGSVPDSPSTSYSNRCQSPSIDMSDFSTVTISETRGSSCISSDVSASVGPSESPSRLPSSGFCSLSPTPLPHDLDISRPESRELDESVHSLPTTGGAELEDSLQTASIQPHRRSITPTIQNFCESKMNFLKELPENLQRYRSKLDIEPTEKNLEGLNAISVHTMAKLVRGEMDDVFDSIIVLDCRYDYEFEGGRIQNAINVTSTAQVDELLFRKPKGGDRVAIIAHCEFSQRRGPTMCRHIRGRDRQIHGYKYFPWLYYPELHIMKGGYKEFYKHYPELCNPQGYVSMFDKKFDAALRDRSKKRSRTKVLGKLGFERSRSCDSLSLIGNTGVRLFGDVETKKASPRLPTIPSWIPLAARASQKPAESGFVSLPKSLNPGNPEFELQCPRRLNFSKPSNPTEQVAPSKLKSSLPKVSVLSVLGVSLVFFFCSGSTL